MSHVNNAGLTDLKGYPLVMAVSEDALNAKFAEIYGKSTLDSERFPHVPWKLVGHKGAFTLEVQEFGAPQLDFDTDVKHGCRLKMTILKGSYNTWTLDMNEIVDGLPKPIQVKMPLDGISFYVISDVRQIKHEEWCDEDFEAQALFMDLERIKDVSVDFSTHDNAPSLGAVKVGLEKIIQDRLTEIGEKDPQALLFGAVKVPPVANSQRSSGPLEPKKATYSVTRTPPTGTYVCGDLNYLLLTDAEDEFPNFGGAGVFPHSLIRGGADAMLVLSEATILEKFVEPALKSCWSGIKLKLHRGTFPSDKASLKLQDTLKFGVTLDGHGRSAYLTQCDVTIENNRVAVNYTWTSSFYHWSHDIHAAMSGYQHIYMFMNNGELDSRVEAPEPHIATSDTHLWKRILGDILTVGFDEIGRKNTSDSGKGSMQAFSKDIFKHAKTVLGRMILPGGGVWHEVHAELDNQLYVTASYKA